MIYKDASIGNFVNIAVVKFTVLNEKEASEIIQSPATQTLGNFCRWQKMYNQRHDWNFFHYDTAILLIRKNLCQKNDNCDTLGLAQSGRICDTSSSCSIVEDNGLAAAFTIAHEVGHMCVHVLLSINLDCSFQFILFQTRNTS